MHGYCSGFALLVNAELVSMGGVVDLKVGGGINLSPRQAVIEETKAELRQHYVSYAEARRELDFLEKGGDPLDFRIGNAASLSVHSTSLTDHYPKLLGASEAKDSFALPASPPGDSVESSGRPGAPPASEPNSADNLMLFDGENDFLKGERSSIHSGGSNVGPSEQSSPLVGSQNAKGSGDSVAFGIPKKAYKRRNRSRPSRDGARSSSVDVVPSRGGHASLSSHHVRNDAKGLPIDAGNQKDKTVSTNSNSKPTSPIFSMVPNVEPSNTLLDLELHDSKADTSNPSNSHDNQPNQLVGPDAQSALIDVTPANPEFQEGREEVAIHGFTPSMATAEVEDQVVSSQVNGFSSGMGDKKSTLNGLQKDTIFDNGLDSESTFTQTHPIRDGNIDGEICTDLSNGGPDKDSKEEIVAFEEMPSMEGDKLLEENNVIRAVGICSVGNDDFNSVKQSHQKNGSNVKNEESLKEQGSASQVEMKGSSAVEGMEPDGLTPSKKERKHSDLLVLNSTHVNENDCIGRVHNSMDSVQGIPETALSARACAVSPGPQICSQVNLELTTKDHEDAILEEARVIEAKHKRIAELSVCTLPLENRWKSHHGFVLEEMAWLANDFAQERIWKITAASQIGRQVASAARLKLVEQNSRLKQKKTAYNLAKVVMDFWRFIEELKKPVNVLAKPVHGYALRFLEYNASCVKYVHAEEHMTSDSISDLGILEISWPVNLMEENLFYSVPGGALEVYRKSIESHLIQSEKTGSSMQEEAETSGYDALADFGSQENAFEEEEVETSTYYLPGVFESRKPSKFSQKKRKHLVKAYAARAYEMGSDSPFMQCNENKVGNYQSVIIGKRPANSLNVSIPIKRVRTASRQRVTSPFSAGTHGCVPAPIKTDASSGDTNSFQDDQSTLQGVSHPNNLEVESVQNFEKQVPFDSSEISHKPKKKKKAKNLGSTYEQRWQMDSNFQNEQRENLKRRPENHQLESNGSSSLYGQHVMKKPKILKQSLNYSVDNLTPMGGSIPSPVASQMSNMSNPNKLIKMLGGRDRNRKAKSLKAPTGQSGSGSLWSLFEDQALVVLVHDMGPNWELVGDAFNSNLKFKCIFRKPKECKERHKFLMDSPTGDGADSAEDSGSSQPYRSTLPGIPKGSARQLFQRLQGPMEEDAIKSHLEKIIAIGKRQHHKRSQDPKQLQQPHNSHTFSLSQVCPNNMSGGPVLTPLDLCDANESSSGGHSLGYQSPHTGGLAASNPGSVASVLPASGVNSLVQASSNVVLGNNYSSPSGLNSSARDGRFSIPRSASLSTDEQQKIQQYNQILSGRNIQQSSMPVPGIHAGIDHGVRMLTNGNGVGIACGLNRTTPMARPGIQGIATSSVLNSGGVLSSGIVAMPNPVNIHPGAGQGNSMIRPRDALHMMRRQMIAPELQMQVSQGNNQGVSAFGGFSPSFSNQTNHSPVQSYPLHHPHAMSVQQPHVVGTSQHPHLQGSNIATNTQKQAYAIRLAKERQIQQRLFQQQQQQQQQQFAASNALIPHVQGQTQLPVSSPQTTVQLQSQPSPPVSVSPLISSSSSMTAMSQHQQKHPHGVGPNPQIGGSGMTNQTGKQRPHQPQHPQIQQAGRHHPLQRQQVQTQQQAKILKGAGRGNIMHQNLSMDHNLLNGLPNTSGSQSTEKGEQVIHTIQGQDCGPGSISIQPQKQFVPPHTSRQPHSQQKIYSGSATSSKQQQRQIPSYSDINNQINILSGVAGPTPSTSVQAFPLPVIPSLNQQQQSQPQPHKKLATQNQTSAKRSQQNCQVNSDLPNKYQSREAQVDPHPVNNSSNDVATATVPGRVNTADVISAASSVGAPQRKAPEPVYDSNKPNHATQLVPVGSSQPSTNSGGELLASVSHVLEQSQLSENLSQTEHVDGVQRSQQPSQLQPPAQLPSVPQQPDESAQQQSQQHSTSSGRQ